MDGYGIFPCIDIYHVNNTGRCKARHCVQRTPESPNSQSVCHEVHAFADKADILKFHFAVVDSTFWWLPKDHEHPRGHFESSNQRNAYIWTYLQLFACISDFKRQCIAAKAVMMQTFKHSPDLRAEKSIEVILKGRKRTTDYISESHN